MEKPPKPPDRRLQILDSALAVLEALGGAGVLEAAEIRKAIEIGKDPDAKLVRSVESALLAAVINPRLSGDEKPDEKGFLSAVSGAFRFKPTPAPTRQHVRRVYREFEHAFAGKP